MVELKRTLSGFQTVQRTLSGFKTTMRRKPKAAAEAPTAAEPAPEQPEKQIKLEQAAPPSILPPDQRTVVVATPAAVPQEGRPH